MAKTIYEIDKELEQLQEQFWNLDLKDIIKIWKQVEEKQAKVTLDIIEKQKEDLEEYKPDKIFENKGLENIEDIEKEFEEELKKRKEIYKNLENIEIYKTADWILENLAKWFKEGFIEANDISLLYRPELENYISIWWKDKLAKYFWMWLGSVTWLLTSPTTYFGWFLWKAAWKGLKYWSKIVFRIKLLKPAEELLIKNIAEKDFLKSVFSVSKKIFWNTVFKDVEDFGKLFWSILGHDVIHSITKDQNYNFDKFKKDLLDTVLFVSFLWFWWNISKNILLKNLEINDFIKKFSGEFITYYWLSKYLQSNLPEEAHLANALSSALLFSISEKNINKPEELVARIQKEKINDLLNIEKLKEKNFLYNFYKEKLKNNIEKTKDIDKAIKNTNKEVELYEKKVFLTKKIPIDKIIHNTKLAEEFNYFIKKYKHEDEIKDEITKMYDYYLNINKFNFDFKDENLNIKFLWKKISDKLKENKEEAIKLLEENKEILKDYIDVDKTIKLLQNNKKKDLILAKKQIKKIPKITKKEIIQKQKELWEKRNDLKFKIFELDKEIEKKDKGIIETMKQFWKNIFYTTKWNLWSFWKSWRNIWYLINIWYKEFLKNYELALNKLQKYEKIINKISKNEKIDKLVVEYFENKRNIEEIENIWYFNKNEIEEIKELKNIITNYLEDVEEKLNKKLIIRKWLFKKFKWLKNYFPYKINREKINEYIEWTEISELKKEIQKQLWIEDRTAEIVDYFIDTSKILKVFKQFKNTKKYPWHLKSRTIEESDFIKKSILNIFSYIYNIEKYLALSDVLGDNFILWKKWKAEFQRKNPHLKSIIDNIEKNILFWKWINWIDKHIYNLTTLLNWIKVINIENTIQSLFDFVRIITTWWPKNTLLGLLDINKLKINVRNENMIKFADNIALLWKTTQDILEWLAKYSWFKQINDFMLKWYISSSLKMFEDAIAEARKWNKQKLIFLEDLLWIKINYTKNINFEKLDEFITDTIFAAKQKFITQNPLEMPIYYKHEIWKYFYQLKTYFYKFYQDFLDNIKIVFNHYWYIGVTKYISLYVVSLYILSYLIAEGLTETTRLFSIILDEDFNNKKEEKIKEAYFYGGFFPYMNNLFLDILEHFGIIETKNRYDFWINNMMPALYYRIKDIESITKWWFDKILKYLPWIWPFIYKIEK